MVFFIECMVMYSFCNENFEEKNIGKEKNNNLEKDYYGIICSYMVYLK